MRKQIGALLLCAALALAGAGCQLAKPEAAGAGQGDRLIGVYITWDYLDTFDMEGYLNDHIGKLSSGGDLVLSEADTAAYSGRIWAEETADGDWVFPGLEGLGCYCPVEETEEGTHIGSHLDEGICSNGLHLTSTDEGDRTEIDCTVYVTASDRACLYCNPVYQTAAGQVYLTGGSGGMSSEGIHDEGELFSTTLSSETSSSVSGQAAKAGSSSVTVRLALMFAPEELVLIQMDEDSRELSRESYVPGRLPEQIRLSKDCAYVLAETHKRDPEGLPVTGRELIELRDGEPTVFTGFYAAENGLCLRQPAELIRP